MNWIITLTRNNLALTKKAIESFRAQEIDIRILVVENDSVDNTAQWLSTQRDIFTIMNKPQAGVAGGWNQALRWLFTPRWKNGREIEKPRADYALVCNNDVELRPDSYRHLIMDGGGFVTCVGSNDPEMIKPRLVFATSDWPEPDPAKKRPHPDFSCFLIRRWVWETVGEFNEEFIGGYCEDADYHLRMHRAGIKAEALELPFLHHAAATVKAADSKEKERIHRQAAANRRLFRQKYGFEVGSPEYYAAFGHGDPAEAQAASRF